MFKSDRRICWSYGPLSTLQKLSFLNPKGPQALFHLTQRITGLQGYCEWRKQTKNKLSILPPRPTHIATAPFAFFLYIMLFKDLCYIHLHSFPLKHMKFSPFLYSVSFIWSMTWESDDLQNFPFQAVHNIPSMSESKWMNLSCTVS